MKKGFTLVELSIVIVVIGLLISGILVGQSLVETAKVNAQVKQIQEFDIAVANFVGKYKSIPGDSRVMGCANYLTYTNCNNGSIDDSFRISISNYGHTWQFDQEIANFWPQLNKSGFTQNGAVFSATAANPLNNSSLTARNIPKATIDAKSGVVAGSAPYPVNGTRNMTFYQIAQYGSYSPMQSMASASITPAQANAIDNKMDDGKPLAGMVLGTYVGDNSVANSWYFGSAIIRSGPCINYTGADATTTYKLSSNDKLCGLVVQIMSGSGGIPGRRTTY